jgi:hypothetical protein
MGKGGGDTTSTVYQSSLPQYAKPYYTSMMERGQAESTRPYQPYQGKRIADQTAQTTAGLNMGQKFAQSGMPGLQNAQGLAGLVGSRAIDLQNYQAGGVDNTYAGKYDPNTYQADQVTAGTFGQQQADQYMSPYMADVTSAAQAETARNAAQEQAMIKAQQGATGAFGGSRGAVQQQIAANAAQQRISDIGVQGRQSAYENAQQQYERDRAAGMSAQQANQKANLDAAQMDEQSRQYAETQAQHAAEMGMTAQQQTEQLRQAGKQLGLEGLKVAGTSAGQLADFQKMSDDMTLSRMQAMLGVGQSMEDRSQKGLDMAYQDFLNQQNWPRQNLSFLSSLLSSQPTGTNTTSSTTTPSNPIAGAAGTAIGLNALYGLGRGQS